MSLMAITNESLTRQIGREVPEVYVVIAKHSVLGMDEDGIREVIGCSPEELSEVLNDSTYREVRLIIGGVHAQGVVDQTAGWDSLEQSALSNLLLRAKMPNQDSEFLLKVAAVANKAIRRANAGKEQGILDPAQGKTAKISLTTRLVRNFTHEGAEQQVVERRLSIEDGSMMNPSFDDVNALLAVSAVPSLPKQLEVKTAMAPVSMVELDKEMERRIKDGG